MSLFDAMLGDCECGASTRDAMLGDVVCTQSEQDAGDQEVQDLTTLYSSTGYKPTKYLTAYKALLDERMGLNDSIDTPWTRACQIKALGERARALHEQIARDVGQVVPPKPDDSSIGGGLKALAAAVGAAAIAAVAYPAVSSLARGSSSAPRRRKRTRRKTR